jgi:hypothetical protein
LSVQRLAVLTEVYCSFTQFLNAYAGMAIISSFHIFLTTSKSITHIEPSIQYFISYAAEKVSFSKEKNIQNGTTQDSPCFPQAAADACGQFSQPERCPLLHAE